MGSRRVCNLVAPCVAQSAVSSHFDQAVDIKLDLQVPSGNYSEKLSREKIGGRRHKGKGRGARCKGGGWRGRQLLVGVEVHVLSGCVVLPPIEHPRGNIVVEWSLNHLQQHKQHAEQHEHHTNGT